MQREKSSALRDFNGVHFLGWLEWKRIGNSSFLKDMMYELGLFNLGRSVEVALTFPPGCCCWWEEVGVVRVVPPSLAASVVV